MALYINGIEGWKHEKEKKKNKDIENSDPLRRYRSLDSIGIQSGIWALCMVRIFYGFMHSLHC